MPDLLNPMSFHNLPLLIGPPSVVQVSLHMASPCNAIEKGDKSILVCRFGGGLRCAVRGIGLSPVMCRDDPPS